MAHRDGEVVASAETYDELAKYRESLATGRGDLIVEYIESADAVYVPTRFIDWSYQDTGAEAGSTDQMCDDDHGSSSVGKRSGGSGEQ